MEQLKKNWPQIAVGAVAVGLSLLLIYQFNKQKSVAGILVDIDEQTKQQDGKIWPKIRRIISHSSGTKSQKKQLQDWKEKVLRVFIQKHGPFQVDKLNNLNEEDFLNIYDLIECFSRCKLKELREANEKKREQLFVNAFSLDNENRKESLNQYLKQIDNDMNQEIQIYQKEQDDVLKLVKINEKIWNSSMDVYLPQGQLYIQKALRFSTASPFTYSGKISQSKIVDIYCSASQFGIEILNKDQDFLAAVKYLYDESFEEQEKLIILDYLMIDQIRNGHGLTSLQFKSAVSASDLVDNEKIQQQMFKVIDAFK